MSVTKQKLPTILLAALLQFLILWAIDYYSIVVSLLIGATWTSGGLLWILAVHLVGKKLFYLTRLQCTDIRSNVVWMIGLGFCYINI